jgi:hypothetical protein
VDPIVVPPEMTTYTWKAGPEATTDCAEPDGFRIWRHAPIRLTADGPVRLCLVGHDPAGNPTPPVDAVLPDGPPVAVPSPWVGETGPVVTAPPRLPGPAA